jgi:hypothetical protein
MSKVNTVDENLKEIFDDQDEANEKRLKLIWELEEENKILWKTIEALKAVLRRV